jgi:iron-sulfur cluster repair protein YtfE (RIC family)
MQAANEKTNIIHEFHADHQKVVSTLTNLRDAISKRDIAAVRALLEATDKHVGPHFKFEELYLYPALRRFVGEAYVQRLVNEHDGIFRSVRRLRQLAGETSWSEADYESAMTNLDLIYEHPIGCDGLSLWIERMSGQEQSELLGEMLEVRHLGTTLSEYERERLRS